MTPMKKIARKRKEPSARQMKTFAKRFHPDDWKQCCTSSAFLQAVCDDLRAAEYIAVKILQDEWTEPTTAEVE